VLGVDGRFEFLGLGKGPYQLTASVKGYRLATGYSPLRPVDAGKLDEERWKKISEFNGSTLRAMNTVETLVEGDIQDFVVRLDPVTPASGP
jgi:hypothetical protein